MPPQPIPDRDTTQRMSPVAGHALWPVGATVRTRGSFAAATNAVAEVVADSRSRGHSGRPRNHRLVVDKTFFSFLYGNIFIYI